MKIAPNKIKPIQIILLINLLGIPSYLLLKYLEVETIPKDNKIIKITIIEWKSFLLATISIKNFKLVLIKMNNYFGYINILSFLISWLQVH